MAIATKLLDVSAQSRAFISGRSLGMVTCIHKNNGRERHGRKMWAGIQVIMWTCVYIPIVNNNPRVQCAL